MESEMGVPRQNNCSKLENWLSGSFMYISVDSLLDSKLGNSLIELRIRLSISLLLMSVVLGP